MKREKPYASAQLKNRDICDGEVVYSNPITGNIDVRVGEEILINCLWISPATSELLGYKIKYMPPPGTPVKLLYVEDGQSWIVGTRPSEEPDMATGRNKRFSGVISLADYKTYRKDIPPNPDARYTGNGYDYEDMLTGEIQMENPLGVGLKFLTELMQMSAGARAKVECHLLDDLVRVVSQNFSHLSSFGHYRIVNDAGKVSVEWLGTSHDHERWGSESPADPKAELSDDDQHQLDLSDPELLRDIGRYRFSQMIGYLGDFVNGFVTDPEKTFQDLMSNREEGEPRERSGKFRWHVGADGTLLVQSVSEIVMERTSRVIVPLRKKEWNEKDGHTSGHDNDSAVKKFLADWDCRKPENAFHACYQLRHQARWLSSLKSLVRFHQMSRDWHVPAESQVPEPDYDNREADRREINGELRERIPFMEVYSTIRLMRDGSIVVMDGYKSAVVMANGSMQLSAPDNILLQAGGDLNLVAGNNISLRSRQHTEISATLGDLLLKGETGLKMLGETGPVLVEANAEDQAFVIRVNKGDGLIRGAGDLTVGAFGQESRLRILNSGNGVRIASSSNVDVTSQSGDIRLLARAGNLKVLARSAFFRLARTFSLNNVFTVVGNVLEFAGGSIKSDRLVSDLIYGKKRPGGLPPHQNHVMAIPDAPEDDPEAYEAWERQWKPVRRAAELAGEMDQLEDELNQNQTGLLEAGQTNLHFDFIAAANRIPDAEDAILETITQQNLRLDEIENVEEWTMGAGGTVQNGRERPWPGDMMQLEFDGGDPLNEPSAKDPKSLTNTGPEPKRNSARMRVRQPEEIE